MFDNFIGGFYLQYWAWFGVKIYEIQLLFNSWWLEFALKTKLSFTSSPGLIYQHFWFNLVFYYSFTVSNSVYLCPKVWLKVHLKWGTKIIMVYLLTGIDLIFSVSGFCNSNMLKTLTTETTVIQNAAFSIGFPSWQIIAVIQ